MKLDKFVHELCTEGKNFAALSTLMPDGSPQVSIVWVDADDEHILINTAEGRIKPKNVRRDPRVAVAIADSENPYRQAMVRGRVVDLTHEGAEEQVDTLAKKYIGQDKYPWRSPDEKRVILKIKPEHVFKLT
ncbi:MAG TPA: PPOX class F420-dependent oxidoreductase [Thermodesulfobacteriota bacterium]|nr:PPOX class F420-dependent oxidoreductase [Thermodesulfobacteriota bacterium]